MPPSRIMLLLLTLVAATITSGRSLNEDSMEKRSIPTRDLLRYFLLAFHKTDRPSAVSSGSSSAWQRPVRRLGSEFLGKRSLSSTKEVTLSKRSADLDFLENDNSEFFMEPEQKRRMGTEFLGKRRMGSEFLGKRAIGSEFLGKRMMGSEFLGKRKMGSEFLGKRAMGSEFLGKRGMGSEFLGKRGLGSEFLGKRGEEPVFLGKRAMGSEFLGKRRMGSEFLGKRRMGSDFLSRLRMGSEFLGKRRMGSEFLGKRDSVYKSKEDNTNADLLELILNQSFNELSNIESNIHLPDLLDKCKITIISENQESNPSASDMSPNAFVTQDGNNVEEINDNMYPLINKVCEILRKRYINDYERSKDVAKDQMSMHNGDDSVRLIPVDTTLAETEASKTTPV